MYKFFSMYTLSTFFIQQYFLTGRYDIARALEKWGGLHEVSRLLSLKVRHPNRQASLAKERKPEVLAPNEDQAPSKPYVSQNTQKWLTRVKEFDINWVE